ncbi:MAG: electron transport complex subunit RsxC [Promethearchaeia archaeon]
MGPNEEHIHHFKENGGFEVDISMKMEAIDEPFQKVPPANEMIVFLRHHIGRETKPLVKQGQSVTFGQKIGGISEKEGMFVPVHSPVNGKVMDITEMKHPLSGKKESAVIIKTTSENEEAPLEPLDPKESTRNELLNRVKEAGIVGLGGAAFPTHLKLSMDKKVSHLIINAKESDPNIACDFRLMTEKPEEIVNGIKLMGKMLDVEDITFATRTREGETPKFGSMLMENGISMKRVRPCYSIGSERLLVKEVLGKEVPSGKYPHDVGVIVHNVSTAYAVARAIHKGEPLVSRGLTFYSKKTGGKNLWVRMGTPVGHILNHVGLSPSDFDRITLGSIMMGPGIDNSSSPVLKATSGVTAFTHREPDPYKDSLPCIRCGYCNTVCPVYIYPQLIMEAEKKGKRKRLKNLHVEDCINCGLCSYVCPSRIKFTKYLIGAKNRIRN